MIASCSICLDSTACRAGLSLTLERTWSIKRAIWVCRSLFSGPIRQRLCQCCAHLKTAKSYSELSRNGNKYRNHLLSNSKSRLHPTEYHNLIRQLAMRRLRTLWLESASLAAMFYKVTTWSQLTTQEWRTLLRSENSTRKLYMTRCFKRWGRSMIPKGRNDWWYWASRLCSRIALD